MTEKTGCIINEKTGFFYMDIDGEFVAKMTFYFRGDSAIVIDHAEVNEEHNGRGYGKRLVADAVQFVREKQLTIIPVCPFVKYVLENTPEYNDVLK